MISNFRIADLPGITDTDIPGNSAMTGKAKTAKHRREKEEKISVLFQHSARNVHCRGKGGNSVTAVAEKEGFMYYISELVAPSL